MGFNGSIPGAARLHLVDGVALLRPEEQVFTAMLTGFANQQLARNLARTTVEGRENAVKAFTAYIGVPVAAARGAAIRQQLLDMPAPVVADALGYHHKTTTRLRNETGGTWSRYAAGDHGRSPIGWAPKKTGES
ncbi:hypothetical protein SSPS47_17715 [Streptomyces sp. S4.7]|uniref:hypothetical protein n=1 Tax=Streptomyces sp. S4.7 TaxID=2705439 RepID=UPI001397A432|nr:hypothetical protein [Streptomyces sp. S4.7]QHY96945.1 hypothetical protein SSPS47_17715 [Streptomyces sp. S4.7]